MVSPRCVLSLSSVFFIQINGSVFVSYNMGSQMSVPIGDHFTKVTDGNYHVVRVTRDGAAATLQVDNNDVIRKDPTSKCNKNYSGDVMHTYFILSMALISKRSALVVYIFLCKYISNKPCLKDV